MWWTGRAGPRDVETGFPHCDVFLPRGHGIQLVASVWATSASKSCPLGLSPQSYYAEGELYTVRRQTPSRGVQT